MSHVTDLADPNRCKGACPTGQCMSVAEYGTEYCKAHGGESLKDVEESRSYLLTQVEYKRRLAQLQVQHEPIRELRDAIALTHLLIEKRMNACTDDIDLMAACAPLNQLLLTMERLCKSAVQIQQNMGALLSKQTVLLLGQQLVKIIIDEMVGVPDYEERVDRINERLFKTITIISNSEESNNA